ncbi:MAG: hypothetical protein ACYDCK_13935, partial [Thermoplasmatota archaeon]
MGGDQVGSTAPGDSLRGGPTDPQGIGSGPSTSTADAGLGSGAKSAFALDPDKLDALEHLLATTSASLGTPLAIPKPTHAIPQAFPLRAAIVNWVLVTGATAPAAELARQLARADALPTDLQHDLAVVLFAAADATLLQRSALAALTPDDISFLSSHPDAIAAYARNPTALDETTARVAALSAHVDRVKSLEAALLVLEAVRETRDPLNADAARLLAQGAPAPATPAVADSAHVGAPDVSALLATLAKLHTNAAMTDAEKLHVAGDIILAVTRTADPRPYVPRLSETAPLGGALESLLGA